MRQTFGNLLRRSRGELFLIVQAFFLLGVARAAILLVQFKRIASWLGKVDTESPHEIGDDMIRNARRVSWAVERASMLTVWTSNCFPQAIVASFLLRRRRIPSTIYLGVAVDGANEMKAHAWLRCGPLIVTGKHRREEFTPVRSFAT